MEKLLIEIETQYHIPRGTLRSAISRKQVRAAKRGGILVVDDADTSFQHFLIHYQPRQPSMQRFASEDGTVRKEQQDGEE